MRSEPNTCCRACRRRGAPRRAAAVPRRRARGPRCPSVLPGRLVRQRPHRSPLREEAARQIPAGVAERARDDVRTRVGHYQLLLLPRRGFVYGTRASKTRASPHAPIATSASGQATNAAHRAPTTTSTMPLATSSRRTTISARGDCVFAQRAGERAPAAMAHAGLHLGPGHAALEPI